MANPAVGWIDDPQAPQFFASGVSGFSVQGGFVTVSFETTRCNHFLAECPTFRVTAGRVTLSVQAAQSLVLELNNVLSLAGRDPSAAARLGLAMQ